MLRNRLAVIVLSLAGTLPTYSTMARAQDATAAASQTEEFVGTVTVTGPQLGAPAGEIQIHVFPLSTDQKVLTVNKVSASERAKLIQASKDGKSVQIKGSVSGNTVNVTSAKIEAVMPLTATDDKTTAAADNPFHGSLGPVKPPILPAEPKVDFNQLKIFTTQVIGPGGVPPTSTLVVKSDGSYTLTTTGNPALGQKTQTYEGRLSPDQMKSLGTAYNKASNASLPKLMPGQMDGGPEFTLTMTGKDGADKTVQGSVAGKKAGQDAAAWDALQPLLTKLQSVQTSAEQAPPTASADALKTDPAQIDRGFSRTPGLSGRLTSETKDGADKSDGKDAADAK